MSNLLKLHEAIAVVLLSKENRTATIHEISKEIAARGLYFQKSGELHHLSKLGYALIPLPALGNDIATYSNMLSRIR